MAVQQATIGSTTVAGLLGIVNNNAAQQTTDEANIATLQAQVANLMKSSSPPGAYQPPTKAGSQFYATASAWNYARTTAAGGLLAGTATSTRYTSAYLNIYNYADVWVPGSNIDFVSYVNQANGYMTFARVQRPAQGGTTAPTIIASGAIASNTYYSLLAVCIISSTVVRVTVCNTNNSEIYEYTVTFANNALSITQNSGNPYAGGNIPTSTTYGLGQMRAFLTGSSSFIAVYQAISSASLASGVSINDVGFVQKDRSTTTISQVAIASSCFEVYNSTTGRAGPQYNINCVADQVGNGYFLRGGSNWTAADGTNRPCIWFEYVDDYNANRLQTLRITNTTFLGWVSLMCVSSTLAIGVYQDASSNYWMVAISINTGNSTPLGLYGPVAISAAPVVPNSYLFFDNTDIYFPTACTSAGVVTFGHIAFSTSSPYLTFTANVFTCQLYNGTTISSCYIASMVQTNTDQFSLNYTYGIGSNYNSSYEVFTLSSS